MDENGHRTPALVKGLATVGAGFLGWVTLAALFTPTATLPSPRGARSEKRRTAEVPGGHRPSQVYRGNNVEVMADGAEFYRSMVDGSARPSGRSILKPLS